MKNKSRNIIGRREFAKLTCFAIGGSIFGLGCKKEDLEGPISNESWIERVLKNKPVKTEWRQFAEAAGIDIWNNITPEKLAQNTQKLRGTSPSQQNSNINPLLEGRNIYFDDEWLRYISSVEHPLRISETDFAKWRDRSDMVYDAYVYLTGVLPRKGEKIKIEIKDIKAAAQAATKSALIQYSYGGVADGLDMINKYDSWVLVQMHELSHIFDWENGKKRGWCAESESLANFKIIFAMEALDAKFFCREFQWTKIVGEGGNIMASGDSFREGVLDEIKNRHIQNTLSTFSSEGRNTASEFDYYLYTLSKHVGWEPIMLAFRSYTNKKLENLLYEKETRSVRQARTFIERIAHYSGSQELLKQISDFVLNK